MPMERAHGPRRLSRPESFLRRRLPVTATMATMNDRDGPAGQQGNGGAAVDSSPRQRYGATVWQRLGPVFPMLVVGVALLVTSLAGSPPPDALAAWLTICFGRRT